MSDHAFKIAQSESSRNNLEILSYNIDESYGIFCTPSNSEIICGQNVSTKVVCGIIFFFEKIAMLKI